MVNETKETNSTLSCSCEHFTVFEALISLLQAHRKNTFFILQTSDVEELCEDLIKTNYALQDRHCD